MKDRKGKKTGAIYCMQSCEHPCLSLAACLTAFLSVLGEPCLKIVLTILMVFAISLQWCLKQHTQEKQGFFSDNFKPKFDKVLLKSSNFYNKC